MCVFLASIRHVVFILDFVGHLNLTKQSVRVIFAEFTCFVFLCLLVHVYISRKPGLSDLELELDYLILNLNWI